VFFLSLNLSQLKQVLVLFIQQNLQAQDQKPGADAELDLGGGRHLIPFIVVMQEVS